MGTLRLATCATHVQNRAAEAKKRSDDEAESKKLDDNIEGNSVDFTSGEAMVPLRGGGRLHCYGDFSAGPDAPVVLMIHWYEKRSVDAKAWRPMFADLRTAGCNFLAPDMPGHGSSSGHCSGKPEGYCEEGGPVDVIRQLLDACGRKRAIVTGYDWGGGVACAFAAKHPNRIEKFVWCASVREPKELEKLQKKVKQGDVIVLWAKNDSFHDYRKGKEIAA